MNGGRIEQHGTPADIFNKPKSRFAADFLGHSNLLEGEVEEIQEDSGITVRLTGGTRIQAPPLSGYKKNDPVWLFFRSGRTGICTAPGNGKNILPGKLIYKEYYGTHTLFEVETEGAIVKAESLNPLPAKKREMSIGQEVYVSVPEEHCYLIERLSMI